MTSAWPSMSTATTCRSIQLQNHSLPSCHRGDSGIPRPFSRIFGSVITLFSSPALPVSGRPSTPTRTVTSPIDSTGPRAHRGSRNLPAGEPRGVADGRSVGPLLEHLEVPDRVPAVLPLLLEDHV